MAGQILLLPESLLQLVVAGAADVHPLQWLILDYTCGRLRELLPRLVRDDLLRLSPAAKAEAVRWFMSQFVEGGPHCWARLSMLTEV